MRDMNAATHNRRGRPATASPDDVLGAATAQYLAGRRADLTESARGLGMSRATIYRWFGSRESLLGEVLARQFEMLVAHRRAAVRERGPRGLLEVFDRINRDLSRSKPLRRLLEQEPSGGMRSAHVDRGLSSSRGRGGLRRAPDRRGGRGRAAMTPPAEPGNPRLRGRPARRGVPLQRRRPPGSVAITGACTTSRPPCSACREGRAGDGLMNVPINVPNLRLGTLASLALAAVKSRSSFHAASPWCSA